MEIFILFPEGRRHFLAKYFPMAQSPIFKEQQEKGPYHDGDKKVAKNVGDDFENRKKDISDSFAVLYEGFILKKHMLGFFQSSMFSQGHIH